MPSLQSIQPKFQGLYVSISPNSESQNSPITEYQVKAQFVPDHEFDTVQVRFSLVQDRNRSSAFSFRDQRVLDLAREFQKIQDGKDQDATKEFLARFPNQVADILQDVSAKETSLQNGFDRYIWGSADSFWPSGLYQNLNDRPEMARYLKKLVDLSKELLPPAVANAKERTLFPPSITTNTRTRDTGEDNPFTYTEVTADFNGIVENAPTDLKAIMKSVPPTAW